MINKILIALVFALNLSGCESYFYNNERGDYNLANDLRRWIKNANVTLPAQVDQYATILKFEYSGMDINRNHSYTAYYSLNMDNDWAKENIPAVKTAMIEKYCYQNDWKSKFDRKWNIALIINIVDKNNTQVSKFRITNREC